VSDQKSFSPWLGVGAEKYNAVFTAIESGEIESFDRTKLLESARVLAAFHSRHVAQDQTAAALLIHNLQIAHTLQEIDRTNRRLQLFVTILGVVTLVVGCLPDIFYSLSEEPLITRHDHYKR
jgi:hypothetical protein